MRTVKQLLQTKGYDIWSVGPDSSVDEALRLMADKNVGALVVLERGKLVGIFSERDFARTVARNRQLSLDIPVRQIMTPKVFYVHPDQTFGECLALMSDKRIRHLPVLEDDQLIGLVSIGDVVKAIISDQEFMIEQLESYIVGS